MERFVVIRYSRVFPYPLAACFEWLTDYQDDDPARTTAVVVSRPVVSRSADLVVLDGELDIAGRRGKGRVEVRLHRPDRYVATIVAGSGKGSVYEYRLTPVAGGTRLDVDYRVRVRRWSSWLKVTLAKPVAAAQIRRMWDGFARAMARDLASAPPAR